MTSADAAPAPKAKPAGGPRDAVIEATMRLAAERGFADVTISDIARECGLSLADFRDLFPSKGAVLGAFGRKIDRAVLDGTAAETFASEPARERLYEILHARLNALAPYRAALQSIADWAAHDPLSATALNRETVNSMRFMLEAADIDSEGPVGALKLQGLAFAWKRVLDAWFAEGDMIHALSTLDRELGHGETLVDRAEDLARVTEPLRSLAHKLLDTVTGRAKRKPAHEPYDDDYADEEHPHASA